jgi:hypothetical protein
MFLLLSSAAQPRYREDILRCLAAPLGATIQFRYRKQWIECQSPESLIGKEGLVCFADDSRTEQLLLNPVRQVTIEHVSVHGTTASLILKMGDFAYAKTEDFSVQISNIAGAYHPRKENGASHGKWIFSVDETKLTGIIRNKSLTTWQNIVEELANKPQFKNEPFYWTVVGIEPIAKPGIDYSECLAWSDRLPRNSLQNLLIYHYFPANKPSESKVPVLTLSSGGCIHAISSTEVRIDSPYDLRRWRFQAQATDHSPKPGWIDIRDPSGWTIELTIVTEWNLWVLGFLVFLLGASLAAPHIFPSVIAAVVSSTVAAILTVFGIRKSV